MTFNILKNKTLIIAVNIVILNVSKIYCDALNLVMLFERGGKNTVEFSEPANHAEPGPIASTLIRSIGSSIPVITSSPVIKYLCMLAEIFGNENKEQKEKRQTWQVKLNNYLSGVDIYLSKNNNFTVILSKGSNLQEFNLDNLTKITFKDYQELSKIFYNLEQIDIDINDLKNIFSINSKINKNIYILGHGNYSPDLVLNSNTEPYVASMSYDQYKELLNFLNDINCTFLCLSTCYGGGWNLYKMHKTVERQANDIKKIIFSINQLKFPIVVFAVTDQKATITSKSSLWSFFKHLEEFLSNKRDQAIGDWIITNPIKKILGYISDKDINNTPLVWLPGTDQFFKAVNVDNLVKIITLNSLLNLELKGAKLIDIEDEQAILIYPLVIDIPIFIKSTNFPKVTSMIPGKSHHFINEINAPKANLEDMLEKFGFFKGGGNTQSMQYAQSGLGIAKRAFFIKSLRCKKSNLSGSRLNNVLIKIEYYKYPGLSYLKPMVKFIAKALNGKYFTLLLLPETILISLSNKNLLSDYKIIKNIGDFTFIVKKSFANENDAKNEIKNELKFMEPNPHALSDILSGKQGEKIFWQNVKKSLK